MVNQSLEGLEGLDEALLAQIAAVDDMTPFFDTTGADLVLSIQDRFEKGRTPDGELWEPSQRVLKHGGQTLVDHSHLVGSMTHSPTRKNVEAGTNMVYAAIQNLGGNAGRGGSAEIPGREFMGVNAEDEAMIMDNLFDYFSEVMP